MNTMIIRNTTGSNMKSIISRMKSLYILLMSLFILACSPGKKDAAVVQKSDHVNTQEKEASPAQVEEEPDRTEELYNEIKDLFSGSWMDTYVSIDGEREVSWGIVPYSNQSYFIIDFQNNKRIIIRGATEGGKKGFDTYIGEVIKIIKVEIGLYRFSYKDTLDTFNPKKIKEIILRYNPENDTMAIIGYGDNLYENPSEMIRISEPLHK